MRDGGALIPPHTTQRYAQRVSNASATTNTTACSSIDDCSANGECVAGVCVCDAAFTGKSCAVFNLLPLRPSEGEGYRRYELGGSRVSSWCGAVLLGDDGKYHMWSSEMSNGAGIKAWNTNSQIVHAVADNPERPWDFKRQGVVFEAWSHEPSVVRAPTGEYVMYFSSTVGHGPDENAFPCTGVLCPGKNGTSDASCPADEACTLPKSAWGMKTKMSYAPTPYGPWSSPLVVPVPGSVHQDQNLACIIEQDGSAVCLGRVYLGRVVAKHWKDASTYATTPVEQLPSPPPSPSALVTAGSLHRPVDALRAMSNGEDPFLWKSRGVLHVVMHAAGVPPWGQPWGFHAWSHDRGATWRLPGLQPTGAPFDAYGPRVEIEGQPPRVLSRRERPYVVLGPAGIPVALSTAVTEGPCVMKPTNLPPPRAFAPDCPDDYCYTLVQPFVRQPDGAADTEHASGAGGVDG